MLSVAVCVDAIWIRPVDAMAAKVTGDSNNGSSTVGRLTLRECGPRGGLYANGAHGKAAPKRQARRLSSARLVVESPERRANLGTLTK